MLERAFNSSRFLVLIIVAMSMLSAVMLYFSTVVVVWNLVLDLFTRPIGSATTNDNCNANYYHL